MAEKELVVNRLVPFAGYAFTAALFAYAFFDLRAMDYFLLKGAILVWVTELIVINSTPFTFAALRGIKNNVYKGIALTGLYGFYPMIVGSFGFFITGSFLPLLFFWFSSGLKIAGEWRAESKSVISTKYKISIFAFLIITALAWIGGETFCTGNFAGLIQESGVGYNEIFMGCPQAIGLWGIAYFSLMALAELLVKKSGEEGNANKPKAKTIRLF